MRVRGKGCCLTLGSDSQGKASRYNGDMYCGPGLDLLVSDSQESVPRPVLVVQTGLFRRILNWCIIFNQNFFIS